MILTLFDELEANTKEDRELKYLLILQAYIEMQISKGQSVTLLLQMIHEAQTIESAFNYEAMERQIAEFEKLRTNERRKKSTVT